MSKKILTALLIISSLSLTHCNEQGALFDPIGNSFSAPIAVAVDTAKNRAYVVNSNNNYAFTNATLSILDLTSPASPALLSNTSNPISIPNYSAQIYLDPATSQVYIPNRLSDNNNDTADSLLRINLDESSSSFATINTFSVGDNPFGVACCDGSGRLYVVNTGGTVNVYNPADLSTSVQISLAVTLSSGAASGASSTEVALLGSQAFVTNQAGRIYVLNTSDVGDTSKNPVDYVITNTGFTKGIATDGTLIYAVDGTGGASVLRIINPATLTPISPDTSSISEVDVSTIQTTTVALGNDPNEVIIFNAKAYVTNRGDDTVSVIDLSTNTVTTTIAAGDEPFGMAAFTSGGNNYLYVTNLVGNSISIIDLATNSVAATFAP